jgi:Cellulose binding domain
VSIVNALYLAQDYLGWLASGVTNIDWWQIHNNLVTTGDNGSSLYGTANYGDYGVLSDATCGTVGSAQVCEPAADTPFPAYYGLKLLSQFIHPADTLVSATSSQSLVRAYAVKAADGSLRVLLVNDDPSNSYTVGLSYSGFTPGSSTPSVATLAPPGTSITTAATGSATSQTIAPYSAAMITLQPGSGGSPSPSPSPSPTPTPSSSPSGSGTCHVVYSTQSQWTGGFTANVTLTNTGAAAWTSWRVGFTYPGDQKVTSSWNTGSITQSGEGITATNAPYNGSVAPGASTSFGMQGTWTNSDAPPASLTVNGAACS